MGDTKIPFETALVGHHREFMDAGCCERFAGVGDGKMIVKTSFSATSNIRLDDYWDIEHDNAKYSFVVNLNGYITGVDISVKTNETPLFDTRQSPPLVCPPHGAINLCTLLAKELEISSSSISMNGYLIINTESYDAEFIFESEEEKKQSNLYNFKISHLKNEKEAVPFDLIARTIFYDYAQEHKDVLFLFKNANIYLANGDYRHSFYESYLAIELLYSNGNTNNEVTKRNFLKSEVLCSAINMAQNDIMSISRDNDDSEFLDFIKQTNSAEGIIAKIVNTRGRYFHALNNYKRKKVWDSTNKDILVDESLFMIFVCQHVIDSFNHIYSDAIISKYSEACAKANVLRKFTIKISCKKNCIAEQYTIITNYATMKIGKSTLYNLATEIYERCIEKGESLTDFQIYLGDREVYSKSEFDEQNKNFANINKYN